MPCVFLIKGKRGRGKTSYAARLAEELIKSGFRVGGILAAGLWENGVRSGFDLVVLGSGERLPLCRRNMISSLSAGPFGFYPEAVEIGKKALESAGAAGGIVFLDEVGFMELRGEIWGESLTGLCGKEGITLVITVREELAGIVKERWKMRPAVVNLSDDFGEVLEKIKKTRRRA